MHRPDWKVVALAQLDVLMRRNSQRSLRLVLTVFTLFYALASLLAFNPRSAAAIDAGLGSGNAVVDRSTVPGQTILRYQTVGSSSFIVPYGVTNVQVLVVGGGGGGGAGENAPLGDGAGGGGGGGIRYQASHAVTPGATVSVTVGAGGAGSNVNANMGTSTSDGGNGGNSVFDSLTSIGGGGGGGDDRAGRNGGSGGGGGGQCTAPNTPGTPGGTGTAGQGNNGGGDVGGGTCTVRGGAGGGGYAQTGFDALSIAGGAGGGGGITDISGTSLVYGAGGGGGGGATLGLGGAGGTRAGDGGAAAGGNGGSAAATTGAGGGGGGTVLAVLGTGGDGGNGGSGTVIVRFATVTETTPSVPDMTAATDSGASNTDNLTNDTTPDFTGTCMTGETIQLVVDGTAVAPTQTCTNSTYTITPSVALGAGAHTVAARSTSTSLTSATLSVTVDASAPSAPGVAPDLTAATDTGSSSTDNITSDTTPDFTGTCTTGEVVSIYNGGSLVGQQMCSGSAYTITASTLGNGTHSITSRFTDAAGNQSADSPALSITVDTVAPATPGVAPDLIAASDSGASNTDNITNDTTPTFTGTCTSGELITVLVEGSAAGSATCSGSAYNITTSVLTAGTHSITITATDVAGNQSAASPSLSVTIDATASSAPGTPDLTAATDSGTSNTDNITNDNTPDFTGSCPANGELITVYADGSPVATATCSSGIYTATTSTLTAGAHSITATSTDTAGNISAVSSGLSITIDTSAPSAPGVAPDLSAGSDSGSSSTDNLTNVTTPTFTGSCTNGDIITVLVDGNNVGSATCSGSAYSIATSALGAGAHTVTVTAGDAAGNTSAASPGLSFTIDTTAPAASGTPDMTAATDSGSSDTDNVTSDTTPDFNGSCTNGDTITLFIDGVSAGSATCASSAYTITPSAVAEASHAARVQATDAAGNSNALSNSLTFTIDTTAPAALSAPDMTDSTDSGASNTDNITNDTTPTFSGACANGTIITLFVDGNPVSPTAACSSTGSTYTITPSSAIAGGAHTVTAVQTDSAGNASVVSAGLSITIDTTAPSTPATPDLSAASDTGSSSSDNLTSDTTPTFTGSCVNGDIITVLVDGVGVGSATCSGSAYSITASTLGGGSHTATVTATDGAGNVSSASAGLSFTIDASAPAAPAITAPTSGSTTSDTTPAFNGTGEIGAALTVTDQASAVICTATVDGSGNWLCTPGSPLGNGSYTFKAAQVDAAGNTSPQSATVSVTIDSVAPVAPVITSPANGDSTNDNTPTITGTGEPGATLSLVIDGGAPVTTTVDAFGNWTFTPGVSLATGSHTLSATQTDAANNTSPTSGTTTFTIDTSALGVTVNQKSGQADPTAANSMFFTVVFSKPVNASTFGAGDLTVGTAPSSPGAYVNTFTQLNSTTWEFEIKGMADGTTVTASIDAARVKDLAGNDNLASTSTDNQTTYSVVPPNIVPTVTNDTTPDLTGECSAGNNIQLDLSGPATRTYNTTCGGGSWSFTVPVALPAGTYNVITTDTTIGGLTNPVENQTGAVVVDLTQPTVTVNQKSGQADPTNVNSASFTITFSEVIRASSLVAGDVNVAGTSGTVTTLAQMSPTVWEATVTGMASGDTVSLSLPANSVVDVAGNNNTVSTSTDNQVTYDATAPAAPAITSPTNGSSVSDATPTISGTGENGAAITVEVDGSSVTCAGAPIVVSGGTWTCTPTGSIADGAHTITAFQTDAASNASPDSTAVNVTIDTVAPSAPAAPDLLAASDTGTSNTDNITSDTTPTFTGNCTNGETIRVYSNGSLVGQQTCSGGVYSITTGALADGVRAVTVTAADAAGNESSASAALSVAIDATAPAAPAAPDMTAATDSGLNNPGGILSNDDNITSDNTPDFTGACVAGNTVALLVDGALAGTQLCPVGGSYTITASPAIAEGSHTVTVTATDTAGNVSTASSGLAVVIDSVAPTTPTITSPANGSTTNDTTPSFTGTGETGTYMVAILEANEANPYGCGPSQTDTVGPGNLWTCVLPIDLAEGAHQFNMKLVDQAYNFSPLSSGIVINIDTTAPAVPTADLATASDTGTSNIDNITSDTTPTFVGSCTNGDMLRLYSDGTLVGQQTCAGGAYSITASPALAEGARAITLTAADPVGNVSSTSSPLTVTIDTTAPAALAAADMVAASDTGSSATDNITSDTTPDFTGTCSAGVTVTVYVDGVAAGSQLCPVGGSYTITTSPALTSGAHTVTVTATDAGGNASAPSPGLAITIDASAPSAPVVTAPANGSSTNDATPTVTGTGENGSRVTLLVDGVPVVCAEGNPVVVSGGVWACTPSTPLTDSGHTITATLTDSAGNTSPSSSGISLTVDTTAPSTLDAPDLTAASDTGASNTDNITSDTTPTLAGGCTTGDTIRLYSDGTLVSQQVCSSNAYSITASPALADGTHALTVTATDVANNTSASSPALSIAFDSGAPSTPAAADLAPASDTGVSNTDNITNDSTPTLTGSCTNGDTVSLSLDGGLVGQQICSGGAYSFTPAITDGTHVITVTVADPAGNTSPLSAPLTLTIDTGSDAAPTVTSPASGASTNDTTPTYTGTGQPGGTVTIADSLTNEVACTATVSSSGSWSCTATTPLDEGNHAATIRGTDAAGNPTADGMYLLTIDTTADSAPTITSPTSGQQLTDTTPTFSGQGESGSTVIVRDEGGNALCSVVVDGSNNWTCDSTQALSGGTRTVTATQTDPAGNVSAGSTVSFGVPVTVVDTPSTPAPASTPASNPAASGAAGSLTPEATPQTESQATQSSTTRPGQLFDIRLLVLDSSIASIKDLIGQVTFTSFGSVPTPVDMLFSVVDASGREVWRSDLTDTTIIETEGVFTKRFAALSELPAGSYTLKLHTSYNNGVEDDFTAAFTIDGASSFPWPLVWLGVAILLAIILWLLYRWYRRQKKDDKQKRGRHEA